MQIPSQPKGQHRSEIRAVYGLRGFLRAQRKYSCVRFNCQLGSQYVRRLKAVIIFRTAVGSLPQKLLRGKAACRSGSGTFV